MLYLCHLIFFKLQQNSRMEFCYCPCDPTMNLNLQRPFFLSLVLPRHAADVVYVYTIRNVCKSAICCTLPKERSRQRSIRLQSLLVQSRQRWTPVPSPVWLLHLPTRIWWECLRPDLMETGSWINWQAYTRTIQPIAKLCAHECV